MTPSPSFLAGRHPVPLYPCALALSSTRLRSLRGQLSPRLPCKHAYEAQASPKEAPETGPGTEWTASQRERDKQPGPGWWGNSQHRREVLWTRSRAGGEAATASRERVGLAAGCGRQVRGRGGGVRGAASWLLAGKAGRDFGVVQAGRGWGSSGGLFPPWEGEWQEEGWDPGYTEGPVLVWVEV